MLFNQTSHCLYTALTARVLDLQYFGLSISVSQSLSHAYLSTCTRTNAHIHAYTHLYTPGKSHLLPIITDLFSDINFPKAQFIANENFVTRAVKGNCCNFSNYRHIFIAGNLEKKKKVFHSPKISNSNFQLVRAARIFYSILKILLIYLVFRKRGMERETPM